jgi:hypothetical protein
MKVTPAPDSGRGPGETPAVESAIRMMISHVRRQIGERRHKLCSLPMIVPISQPNTKAAAAISHHAMAARSRAACSGK